MSLGKMPRYALYFRWGSFQFSLVGRRPLLAWVTVLASALGIKLFGFL
jgi:hypothetical protein